MINAFFDLALPCHEDIDWSQYKKSMGNILKISEYMYGICSTVGIR